MVKHQAGSYRCHPCCEGRRSKRSKGPDDTETGACGDVWCGSAVLCSSANSFRETADQTVWKLGNQGQEHKSKRTGTSQDRCSCLLNSDLNISVRVV